jgi:NitT/TauT family transport system substrate-binding protein
MTANIIRRGLCAALGLTMMSAFAIGTAHAADPLKVRFILNWKFQGPQAWFFLADDKGYFKKAGIDIQLDQGAGSGAAVPRVASTAYDAGFGDINAITRFAAKHKGKQPVAVYMIYNQTPFVIATPKSAKIMKPQQLEGLTLGAPANDGAYKLFPAFANIAGFDAGKVKWQHMKPNLRVTMLKQKKVQGVSGYQLTVLFDAMRVGMNPETDLDFMRFADFGMDLYSNAVMVSQDMLKNHPDKVKGMVAAINKAFWEVVANPEVGVDAVMRREPLLKRASERDRLMATLKHLIISPEMKKVGMGGIDPERLKRSIKIVSSAFKLKRTPAPDEVFQTQFLPPMAERMGK